MDIKNLINWYSDKHAAYTGKNLPLKSESINVLNEFTQQLLKYIKKYSPGDMAPELDQHASFEVNSKGNRICKRDSAACDIFVEGFENQMHIIAEFVINELPFDRLYFYGSDRPIHITFGPDHKRYLHVKHRDEQGKRNVGKGASEIKPLSLLQNSL